MSGCYLITRNNKSPIDYDIAVCWARCFEVPKWIAPDIGKAMVGLFISGLQDLRVQTTPFVLSAEWTSRTRIDSSFGNGSCIWPPPIHFRRAVKAFDIVA